MTPAQESGSHGPLRPSQAFRQGVEAIRRGRDEEAFEAASGLLRDDEHNPEGCHLMALVSAYRRVPDEAVHWARQGLKRGPRPPLQAILARACHMAGDCEACIREAEAISQDAAVWPEAAWWQAMSLERLHRDNEAAALLELLHEAGHRRPRGVLLQARLAARAGRLDEAIADIEAMQASMHLTPRELARARFELAKLRDRAGRYDEAFEAAAGGNALLGTAFQAALWQSDTQAIIDRFPAERMQAPQAAAPPITPVFIIGLPRSGTSLTEQITAAHPDAVGTGERRELLTRAPALMQAIDAGTLTEAGIGEASADVLTAMTRDAPRATVVTCKPLGLERVAGLIPMIAPNARVVFVRRDPRDCLLSIYLHLIRAEVHPWSTTLDGLVTNWQCVQHLWTHWKATLPCPWMELEYESLVTDPNLQTRRLIEFLGLDWSDRCLEFHTLERTVATPSWDQVDKPLNSTAIGRWRHYEKHLGPLLDAFGTESWTPTNPP